jgi:hypothetical protein
MRKSFITKEYSQEARPGTLAMQEKRSFFGSKIMEIEDIIRVDENQIIWTESRDKAQGVGIEDQTGRIDPNDLKNENHGIRIYPQQSDQDRLENTRWEITIDINTIIRDWIFGQIKRSRAFEGISNNQTFSNSVDTSIYEYIDSNIFPRIKFTTIDMYVVYYDLGDTYTLNGEETIALQYDTLYRPDLIQPSQSSGESNAQFLVRQRLWKNSIRVTNFQLTTDPFGNVATIVYKQTQSSQKSKFDYYFDVIYEKA